MTISSKNKIDIVILKKIVWMFLISLLCSPLVGQGVGKMDIDKTETESDCEQLLEKAEDIYQKKGYNQNIIDILKEVQDCDNNKDVLFEINLLMAKVYVLLNEEGKADKYYRKVLKYKPTYTPDTKKEPFEFIQYHYSILNLNPPKIQVKEPKLKFKPYDDLMPSPKFSITPYLTTNFTKVQERKVYSIHNETSCQDCYKNAPITIGAGIQFGYYFSKYLEISIGAAYKIRQYNYERPNIRTNSTLDDFQYNLELQESQEWIDIPLQLKYKLGNKNFVPYVYVGVEFNYLKDAKFKFIESSADGEVIKRKTDVELQGGEREDKKEMRHQPNYSILVGKGLDIRVLKKHFINFDVQYGFMPKSIVNIENRYANNVLLYEYGHVDNLFWMHNISVSVGFKMAFYTIHKF